MNNLRRATLSLEQDRAIAAQQRVQEIKAEARDDDDFKKKYCAYVERLGPSIIMNGLGQALATEQAAAGSPAESGNRPSAEERAHSKLYESLQIWLCHQDGGIFPAEDDVLMAIMHATQEEYIRAQIEALAWLEWHKKFCRSYLKTKE